MGHYDECRPGYCGSCGAAPGNMVNGECPFCTKPKRKESNLSKTNTLNVASGNPQTFNLITEYLRENPPIEWHEVNKRWLMVESQTERILASVTVAADGIAFYGTTSYLTVNGAKKAAEQEYKCKATTKST